MPEPIQAGLEQYHTRDSSLTVYLNGFGYVTTSAPLKTENGVAQIVGIPSEVMLESLHLILGSSDVRIAGARIVEPTTLAEIAQGYIGKKVYDPSIDGSNEEVSVLGISGDGLLVKLKGEGAVYSKPLDSFRYPQKGIPAIRHRQALELRLEGVKDGGNTRTLDLAYLTNGIELSPHYNICLRGDKLTLEAEVVVDNQTGKSYKDVELSVVPGKVEKPEVRHFHRRRAEIMALDSMAVEEVSSLSGVTRSEEDGQIVYHMGKRDLPLGESKFGVLKPNELDYKVVYSAHVGRGARPEISTLLRFETPMTLPVGSVAVYSEGTTGKGKDIVEKYEGGGQISHPVLKGKEVNIDLRTPDTLEMKVEQVGVIRVVKTQIGEKGKPIFALEREFRVTANNAGEDNATIETYLGFTEFQRLVDFSLDTKGDVKGSNARWDVLVEAGKETTFTYKVQTLGFSQMTREQLRRLLKREMPRMPSGDENLE